MTSSRPRTCACYSCWTRTDSCSVACSARTFRQSPRWRGPLEAKDPYTGGHTERVAEIALLLARELGFDESELPAINVGAIIHDIGKVGTPDQILSKPGALTAEEMREIRKHPELASHIVAELELPTWSSRWPAATTSATTATGIRMG